MYSEVNPNTNIMNFQIDVVNLKDHSSITLKWCKPSLKIGSYASTDGQTMTDASPVEGFGRGPNFRCAFPGELVDKKSC